MFENFKEIITNSAAETAKLGGSLALKIKGGEVICLAGDLGAGKTTFTQGFLRALGVEGAITSPTFVVIKNYTLLTSVLELENIYHIDTYRVGEQDLLDLGWEEMIANKKNVIIVEWPEKIEKIIPEGAWWIDFNLLNETQRKISSNLF